MIAYCWDSEGYALESRTIPEGHPLPENGVEIPFPALAGYQAARINDARDGWNVVEDYLGALVRDNTTGERCQITARGPLPEGFTLVSEEEVEAGLAAEQIIQDFTAKVQQRLDAFARSEGKFYDNMLSLCTYATSTNPVFAREGQYGVEARDATWAAAYGVMNAVLAGKRPVPAWEELEAELPALAWPE